MIGTITISYRDYDVNEPQPVRYFRWMCDACGLGQSFLESADVAEKTATEHSVQCAATKALLAKDAASKKARSS